MVYKRPPNCTGINITTVRCEYLYTHSVSDTVGYENENTTRRRLTGNIQFEGCPRFLKQSVTWSSAQVIQCRCVTDTHTHIYWDFCHNSVCIKQVKTVNRKLNKNHMWRNKHTKDWRFLLILLDSPTQRRREESVSRNRNTAPLVLFTLLQTNPRTGVDGVQGPRQVLSPSIIRHPSSVIRQLVHPSFI